MTDEKTETIYKVRHKEAWCIMHYRCGSCGHHEVLYNGRDGVTPFVIGCAKCGEDSAHVSWQKDFRAPTYEPLTGMRIFVDLSFDRYKEFAIKKYQKGGVYEGLIDNGGGDKTLEDLIKELWEDIPENAPTVIVFDKDDKEHIDSIKRPPVGAKLVYPQPDPKRFA